MVLIAVRIDGKAVGMPTGRSELDVTLNIDYSEMMVLWELDSPGLGPAVEVTTGKRLHAAAHRSRLACLCRSSALAASCPLPNKLDSKGAPAQKVKS